MSRLNEYNNIYHNIIIFETWVKHLHNILQVYVTAAMIFCAISSQKLIIPHTKTWMWE